MRDGVQDYQAHGWPTWHGKAGMDGGRRAQGAKAKGRSPLF